MRLQWRGLGDQQCPERPRQRVRLKVFVPIRLCCAIDPGDFMGEMTHSRKEVRERFAGAVEFIDHGMVSNVESNEVDVRFGYKSGHDCAEAASSIN